MPELKPDDFVRITTLFAPDVVTSIAISPNKAYLAIAAGDKLHIHRIPAALSGTAGASAPEFPRIVTLYMPDRIQAIVFSPDGKLLTAAIADKVHIYAVPD